MPVSETNNSPSLLGQAILDAIQEAVRDAVREVAGNGHHRELLDPEELAAKLKVPVSWVYEQSRQGNIPTHRIGKYLRFELQEILVSQAARARKNNI